MTATEAECSLMEGSFHRGISVPRREPRETKVSTLLLYGLATKAVFLRTARGPLREAHFTARRFLALRFGHQTRKLKLAARFHCLIRTISSTRRHDRLLLLRQADTARVGRKDRRAAIRTDLVGRQEVERRVIRHILRLLRDGLRLTQERRRGFNALDRSRRNRSRNLTLRKMLLDRRRLDNRRTKEANQETRNDCGDKGTKNHRCATHPLHHSVENPPAAPKRAAIAIATARRIGLDNANTTEIANIAITKACKILMAVFYSVLMNMKTV